MKTWIGALLAILMVAACTGEVSPPTVSPRGEDPPATKSTTTTVGAPETTVGRSSELTCWVNSADGTAGPIELTEATADYGLVDPLVGLQVHAGAFGDVNGDDHPDLAVGTFADGPEEDYRVRGAEGPNPDLLLVGGPTLQLDPGWSEELGRTSGAVFADFDGDGDSDLVLIRHSGLSRQSEVPSRIYENVEGRLHPRVEPLPPGFLGRTPAVADFDGDGMLDLYVSEDKYGETGGILLRNEGSFVFRDVTVGSGLQGVASLGATAGDLNRDGWPDLATSRRVFLNQGSLMFTDVTPAGYLTDPVTDEDDPAGVAIGDLNRDGWPDVVVGQHFRSTVESDSEVPIRVFLNRLGQAFEDVTSAAAIPAFPTLAPHVQIADLDNDSWPDIVTTASGGQGAFPAVLRNGGGVQPRFESVPGLGSDQYWVGGPVVDLDLDGRLDIFALESEPGLPSLLFHNTGGGGHWLEISVSGPGRGVGSLVEVSTPDGEFLGVGEIGVGGGYASGQLPVAHFGLGAATKVNVMVVGPGGGVTKLEGVLADQHLRIPDGC